MDVMPEEPLMNMQKNGVMPIENNHAVRDVHSPAYEQTMHNPVPYNLEKTPTAPAVRKAARTRRPRQALPAAIAIARKRGFVQQTRECRGALYHFTINGPGLVAFARVRFERDILATLPAISAEFARDIARLRTIVQAACISRELWIRSLHGTFRFFRVMPEGLVEIDHEGNVMGAEGGSAAGWVAG